MQEKFKPSELICIWKNEPCEPGDTLSGGESVRNLVRLGLIESTSAGYVTTSAGKSVVQNMIEFLDSKKVSIRTIVVFE